MKLTGSPLLYVSYLAIHFPWQGPEDPPHRQEGIDYHQDKWGIIPDRKNVAPHVKAMVESVDKGVGEIIEALRQQELEEDTLELYNLTDDLGETRDLSDQHPELVEQLLEEYRRWEEDVTSRYGELQWQEGMP